MKTRTLCLAALASLVATPAHGQDTSGLYDAIGARSIGPAGMSGRVSDVEVVLRDRNIVYVGAATGGELTAGSVMSAVVVADSLRLPSLTVNVTVYVFATV